MNLVFDFGGVVLRWSPPALLRKTLPARAPDQARAEALASEIFQGFLPGGDWALYDLGRIEPAALAERIARRTGLAPAELRAVIDAVPGHLEAQPQTLALLRELARGGHRLFYLSNMPAPCADHLERKHAFMAWFEDGVFSSRVQMMKPEPAIFDAAARRFGIAPAELLFIDDLLHNVEAARALGWQGLHFTGAAECAALLCGLGLERLGG